MLESTLTVEPADAGVAIRLTVENTGEEHARLSFPDGQRAEFAAERAGDGEEVWRWGADRTFAMALGHEDLEPGGTVTYEGTWEGAEPGEYVLRGWLVAREADASAETTVTL